MPKKAMSVKKSVSKPAKKISKMHKKKIDTVIKKLQNLKN